MKKLLEIWFSFKQPIRFILVGGYNTILGYIIFATLNYTLEQYLFAWLILLLSYIIGIANNFVLFKIFVFNTSGNWLKECIKTYYSYIFVYILNALLLYAGTDFFLLSAYVSQAICIVILPIITYFIMKHFTFKPQENQ
jgi:putative flippase GtrA